MKILLATDGSDYSKVAVDAVADRPWPAGSELKIISVMEAPYVPTTDVWVLPDNYYNDLEEAAKAQAQAAVKDAAEEIRSSKTAELETITEVKSGAARNVILDEAERWGADLIILGSHGYSGLQRFLLGSVSHAVATHAHCSVEIVRRKETGKEMAR
jgi:nucleotide-binding universal stress UspA family protein